MSGEAQLEALLEIINTSARQAIAEYKNRGNSVPTLDATEFHPLDFQEDTVALKKAVRLLEGACQQLCATLAPPQHTVINFAQSYDWACTGVAIRARIADILDGHPKGIHVSELAEMVHFEKGKLSRIMRVLASKGCFTEVDTDVFANNRLSLILKSSSNPGCLVRIHAQDVSQGAAVLYETLTEPEYATSYDPDKAPLIYALKKKGLKGSFFDWMKEDDERRESYHRAMIGLGDIMGSLSVLHHYPWDTVSTVCDVGASIGTFSLPLAKKYPHLKITDQDLPEVLVQAKDVWAKDAPEALQGQRVEFIPLNFFEESPVHGKDVYYVSANLYSLLRNIIHDWPDAEAAIILRNVRKALAPHSRLLIHDYVLANVNRKSVAEYMGADVAPEPMLPNFGAGNSRMYQQDLNMWFIHNAKERTLADSIALGSAAGLRLEKVYDLAESAVLEFRLA
ncbi:S-adenosyl-L-methionine-dependent methyltransferase [Leucogyrophana mollusca]|uniref:S-adenosyl-L-methionine-dependent methyltransferase n=1 Tax=Leucogyrophana mollusca TaxID=85980 RepID=A0ACB8BBF3_9AGAM|nr:S-adenosyl-L-methionine-dependent methyltransferase [Leucogyrophana mollusca]